MRRIFLSFFIAAMIFLFSSTWVQAEEGLTKPSKYHKLEATTLNKVKSNASFKLFVPKNIPNEWTVELIFPYPLDTTKQLQGSGYTTLIRKKTFCLV